METSDEIPSKKPKAKAPKEPGQLRFNLSPKIETPVAKKLAEQRARAKSALSPSKGKREISGRRGGQDLTNDQGPDP